MNIKVLKEELKKRPEYDLSENGIDEDFFLKRNMENCGIYSGNPTLASHCTCGFHYETNNKRIKVRN